jgi:hypothetical protein
MGNPARCTCARCSIRGLMGPVVVTTIGVLFLLAEFKSGRLSFGHTFPVLFIVIGAMLLASALAPMEGHVETAAAGVAQPPEPPPYSSPQTGQGQ